MDYTIHGILQAKILEWVAFPFSRGSSEPEIEPRSPTLQTDSLPTEPQGKPKDTGVCSWSLLQQIFPTQELNRGLQHWEQILYQLSYQGSPPGGRLVVRIQPFYCCGQGSIPGWGTEILHAVWCGQNFKKKKKGEICTINSFLALFVFEIGTFVLSTYRLLWGSTQVKYRFERTLGTIKCYYIHKKNKDYFQTYHHAGGLGIPT